LSNRNLVGRSKLQKNSGAPNSNFTTTAQREYKNFTNLIQSKSASRLVRGPKREEEVNKTSGTSGGDIDLGYGAEASQPGRPKVTDLDIKKPFVNESSYSTAHIKMVEEGFYRRPSYKNDIQGPVMTALFKANT